MSIPSVPVKPAPVIPAPVKVPTTRAEAERLLGLIAVDAARLVMTNAILQERLLLAREGVEKQIADINKLLTEKRQALADWAWAAKDAEFTDPKKSIVMLHGTVGFQMGRRQLFLLARTEWPDVIAQLKGKFKKYLKVKYDVDRMGLLKDAISEDKPLPAAALSKLGLKIGQEETFYMELKQS
jgi:hypothetical protein